MRIVGRDKLTDFKACHADSRSAIDAWFAEVASDTCEWSSPQDIKDRYSTASFLSKNRVIFNIGGRKYRLLVVVQFHVSTVAVQWIGTHAEYDKLSL